MESLGSPFYYRPEDYRYTLRSNIACGWWTGVIKNNIQILRCPEAAITFDRKGKLLSVESADKYPIPNEWKDDPTASERVVPAWATEFDFAECPIRVLRFWVPEHSVGIEDMPDTLAEYFTNQEVFLAESGLEVEDVESWQNSDQFVFSTSREYWLNNKGDVESS